MLIVVAVLTMACGQVQAQQSVASKIIILLLMMGGSKINPLHTIKDHR